MPESPKLGIFLLVVGTALAMAALGAHDLNKLYRAYARPKPKDWNVVIQDLRGEIDYKRAKPAPGIFKSGDSNSKEKKGGEKESSQPAHEDKQQLQNVLDSIPWEKPR